MKVEKSFLVSFKDDWKVEAISYTIAYSSLYFSDCLLIKLKDFFPQINSNRINLYDMTLKDRERMLADIEKTGLLRLDKYYPDGGAI